MKNEIETQSWKAVNLLVVHRSGMMQARTYPLKQIIFYSNLNTSYRNEKCPIPIFEF
jgi:hypothetical protein